MMLNLIRRSSLATLMAIMLPTVAHAEVTTKDFVREQAAKAAFVTDVANINRIAGDMFRVAGYAVMRMTHRHWKFDIDNVTENHGQTYAFKINSNAEDAEDAIRRFEVAVSRNKLLTADVKNRAGEMVDLVDQLQELSLELADIYDTGDARRAGDHYHGKIIPVYEAVRRGEATVTSTVSREIKLEAAKFRP